MYREPAAAPCAICEDNPAVAACACCRRAVCKKHLAPESKRGWCKKCDDAYYVYTRRSDGAGKYMAAWWLGAVATALSGFAWSPLFVVGSIGAVVGLPLMQWRYKKSRLQKFLSFTQRTGTQLQLPSATDPTAEAYGLRDYTEIRRNQNAIDE
ncbi:MAG: hypothetical protein QM831_45840 [Kofleriaceae bacterium]